MNKVSVIVPLYNQEKYIEECIISIIEQTYTNIDIVIVDDGSTDSGFEICMLMQKKDERIRVLKKEHGGLVAARKYGVQHAYGDLIMFVDSDDYISKRMIEIMVSNFDSETDIVGCGLNYVYENKEKTARGGNSLPKGIYQGRNLSNIYSKLIYNEKANQSGVFQSACTKLFRNKLLWKCIKNEDENITLGEDAAIVFLYLLESRKVVLLDDCLYYYRVNSASMTHKFNVKVFDKIKIFYEYMKFNIAKYPKEWQLQKQLKMYIVHFLQMAIKSVYDLNFSPLFYIEKHFMNQERIAIYGAGAVGTCFYNNFINNGVKVVGWFDKNRNGILHHIRIQKPDEVVNLEFDYIVIAIRDEAIVKEVRDYLINIGVDKTKIYWEYPKINGYANVIDVGGETEIYD